MKTKQARPKSQQHMQTVRSARKSLQLCDYDFFLKHYGRICDGHAGEYVAIKNRRILGYYKDRVEAIEKTTKEEKLGTFIVQLCTQKKEDAYIRVRRPVSSGV